MSLSYEDLQAIRQIIQDEVGRVVEPLSNDVKEIYDIMVRNNIDIV